MEGPVAHDRAPAPSVVTSYPNNTGPGLRRSVAPHLSGGRLGAGKVFKTTPRGFDSLLLHLPTSETQVFPLVGHILFQHSRPAKTVTGFLSCSHNKCPMWA